MKHCPGCSIDASYKRWQNQAIPCLPSVIISFSTGKFPSEHSAAFSKVHWGSDSKAEVAPHHNCGSELDTSWCHTLDLLVSLGRSISLLCLRVHSILMRYFKWNKGTVCSFFYLHQHLCACGYYNECDRNI